jgi:hypothetical protein
VRDVERVRAREAEEREDAHRREGGDEQAVITFSPKPTSLSDSDAYQSAEKIRFAW